MILRRSITECGTAVASRLLLNNRQHNRFTRVVWGAEAIYIYYLPKHWNTKIRVILLNTDLMHLVFEVNIIVFVQFNLKNNNLVFASKGPDG